MSAPTLAPKELAQIRRDGSDALNGRLLAGPPLRALGGDVLNLLDALEHERMLRQQAERDIERVGAESRLRGELLDRVKTAVGEGWWHGAVDHIERLAGTVARAATADYEAPASDVGQLQQRIADLEEQLRVATGQRRPTEEERIAVAEAEVKIGRILSRLVGLCPGCHGHGVRDCAGGAGPCDECACTGRVGG